jgi:hypothetical protein
VAARKPGPRGRGTGRSPPSSPTSLRPELNVSADAALEQVLANLGLLDTTVSAKMWAHRMPCTAANRACRGVSIVKRTFTASITHEGDWVVAQCLEVDIASQGETEEDALRNLGEALALYFTPPLATALPDLRPVEVEIGAA